MAGFGVYKSIELAWSNKKKLKKRPKRRQGSSSKWNESLGGSYCYFSTVDKLVFDKLFYLIFSFFIIWIASFSFP